MSHFKTVLFVLSCVCLVMGDEATAAWRMHTSRVYKMYPCKVPQPRVFHLKDLIEEMNLKDQYKSIIHKIVPFATVLHRCESSGCCKNYNERCLPNKTENVMLPFATPEGNFLKFFSLEAKNDTECACQKIQDSIIKK